MRIHLLTLFAMSVTLCTCDRGVSAKAQTEIIIPGGRKAKIIKTTHLNGDFSILELQKQTSEPAFAFMKSNDQVLHLNTFSNGFEILIPVNGKLELIATLIESEEGKTLDVRRYALDADGKAIMIDYDSHGEIHKKSPAIDE